MLLELWKDCGFVFVRNGDGLRYLEAGSVSEELNDIELPSAPASLTGLAVRDFTAFLRILFFVQVGMGFREHAKGILWIIVIVSLHGYITGAAAPRPPAALKAASG